MVEFIAVKHSDAVIVLEILLALVFCIVPPCRTEVFNNVVTVRNGLLRELIESRFQHIVSFTNSL